MALWSFTGRQLRCVHFTHAGWGVWWVTHAVPYAVSGMWMGNTSNNCLLQMKSHVLSFFLSVSLCLHFSRFCTVCMRQITLCRLFGKKSDILCAYRRFIFLKVLAITNADSVTINLLSCWMFILFIVSSFWFAAWPIVYPHIRMLLYFTLPSLQVWPHVRAGWSGWFPRIEYAGAEALWSLTLRRYSLIHLIVFATRALFTLIFVSVNPEFGFISRCLYWDTSIGIHFVEAGQWSTQAWADFSPWDRLRWFGGFWLMLWRRKVCPQQKPDSLFRCIGNWLEYHLTRFSYLSI